MDLGSLSASLTYSHLIDFSSTAFPGAAPQTFSGTVGAPDHEAVLNLLYARGPLQVTMGVQYVGEADVGFFDPDLESLLPSMTFVNAQVRYDLNERTSIYAGVDIRLFFSVGIAAAVFLHDAAAWPIIWLIATVAAQLATSWISAPMRREGFVAHLCVGWRLGGRRPADDRQVIGTYAGSDHRPICALGRSSGQRGGDADRWTVGFGAWVIVGSEHNARPAHVVDAPTADVGIHPKGRLRRSSVARGYKQSWDDWSAFQQFRGLHGKLKSQTIPKPLDHWNIPCGRKR